MKAIFMLSIVMQIIYCDAVCTEEEFKAELRQDIADNGKLDCLRKVRPAPTDYKESEEQLRNRLSAVWDSNCAFEADYDWLRYLRLTYGMKSGLVDADGNSVPMDFPEQADMCEIVRALIAGDVIQAKKEGMKDLDPQFIDYINCPGNSDAGQVEICAVSGQSAGQGYAWTIFLKGAALEINKKPTFQQKKQ